MRLNTGNMKFLDNVLGWIPEIFFALVFYLVRKTKPHHLKTTNNLVIIKIFGMGSIFLIMKTLEEFEKPQKLTLVTFHSHLEIAQTLGFDEILTLKRGNIFEFVKDYLNVLGHLARNKPEAVLDLEFYSRATSILSKLIGLFSRKTKTLGFWGHDFVRKYGYDCHIPFSYSIHITNFYREAFRKIGLKDRENVKEEIKLRLKESSRAASLPKDKINICVNPNASDLCLLRRWPADNFSALICELSSEFPDQLFWILSGEKKESDISNRIEEKIRASGVSHINLSGKTSLMEFCKYLLASDILLTNDSGPLHLAAHYGIKTISLWGPSSPLLFGPLGEGHSIIWSKFPCSPCMNNRGRPAGEYCEFSYPCIHAITVPMVKSVLKEKIESIAKKTTNV